MKTSVCRTLEFDAAHRVMNHESKCANLHGHRYKAEIHATADELDSLGRIVDFSVIKERVGSWIDTHWDHTTILHHEDLAATAWATGIIPSQKPIHLATFNPTAEHMAAFLLAHANVLLADTGIKVWKVVLWETPNCKAEVVAE